EGVLSVLRNAGNKHTKIVTLDLSEPIALDMVKDGNVVGIVADEAYALGRAMADAGAYGLLGKPAPAFLVAPALTVTKGNVADGREPLAPPRPPASGPRGGEGRSWLGPGPHPPPPPRPGGRGGAPPRGVGGGGGAEPLPRLATARHPRPSPGQALLPRCGRGV